MLYERIKQLAKEKRLSIAELERRVGLSNGAIGKWVIRTPSATNLYAVAQILDTTVEELLREENE